MECTHGGPSTPHYILLLLSIIEALSEYLWLNLGIEHLSLHGLLAKSKLISTLSTQIHGQQIVAVLQDLAKV